MKGKNLFKLLLALCLTGVPGIALSGCGETDPGTGGGGSQEQPHNVSFDVKKGAVHYINNVGYGDEEFDDITLPKSANAIYYSMISNSEVRKLTIPKNIEKIVDNDGVPCATEFLVREFTLLGKGYINEIVVEDGNLAFSMENGCLMYNGVLLYATPKIAESENLEIDSKNVADNAFSALRNMAEREEFSGNFNLRNLIVDFNNHSKSMALDEVLTILDKYSDKQVYLDSIELRNVPSNVDLSLINARKIVISGSDSVSIQLGDVNNIELKGGIKSFDITLRNEDQVVVNLPTTLKYQSRIYGCSSVVYNIPLTHLEFENSRYYRLLGLDNAFEGEYSYKNIGLQDKINLFDGEANVVLNFKKHSIEDENKIEFYKHFKYEVLNEGVVVTGVYGDEPSGGFVIPEQINGINVIKVMFSDSGVFINNNYVSPTYRISKITLPNTIKEIESETSNYTFEEVRFDGNISECEKIKNEFVKILSGISNLKITCVDGDVKLSEKIFDNAQYIFENNNQETYTVKADFENDNYEIECKIYVNKELRTLKTHKIGQAFEEQANLLYFDLSINEDSCYFYRNLILKREEKFDGESGKYYYDIKLSEDGGSLYTSSTSRQAFEGKIEHKFHDVVIRNATCENEGYVQDKCEICGEVRDSRTLPMLSHDIETNIESEQFGYCKNGCDEYKLGTIRSGFRNNVEYKEIIFGSGYGVQECRNQITELKFPKDITDVIFNDDIKSLFPNLKSICVSNLKEYLNCSFNSGDKPLANGISLKIKNGETNQYELLENLVINDEIFEDVEQWKINDYAFYGYSSLKNLTIQISDNVKKFRVGAYAFGNTNLEKINVVSKYGIIDSTAFIGASVKEIERITTASSSRNAMANLINANPNAKKKDLVIYTSNYSNDSLGKFENAYFENAYIELRVDEYSSSESYSIYEKICANNVYIKDLKTWLELNLYGTYDNAINLNVKNGESYQKVTEIDFNDSELCDIRSISANILNIDGLTNVILSSAITYIEEDAFGASIQEVTAPVSIVKYIGGSVKKLNVVGDSSSSVLMGENNEALPGLFEEVNLSNDITAIGGGTFSGNKALRKINLENVQTVGAGAFNGCSSLESVGKTHKLTEINNYTFYNCSSLLEFNLCAISKVGEQAFKGCSNLTIASSFKNITEISSKAFAGIKAIDELDLTSLSNCSSDAFSGTGVNNVIFNTYYSSFGIKPLKKMVVKSCSGAITLPNFDECMNIEIHLPSGVSTIVGNTNANWKVYFDGSVEDWAKISVINGGVCNLYINGNEIEDVVLENVETIGNAFAGLTSIKTLSINNAKSIGSFADCSNLTSVSIENSTNTNTMNLNETFKNCTSLTSFSCGDKISLTSTFAGCTNLKILIIPNATRSYSSGNNVLNGVREFDQIEASAEFLTSINNNELSGDSKLIVQNLIIRDVKSSGWSYSFGNINVGDSLKFTEGSKSVYGVGNIVKEITIPSSVEIFNVSLFNSLSNNSTLKFNFDISTYASKDYNRSFFGLTNNIKFKNGEMFESASGNITLNGITKIGKNAFNGARNIQTINIPESCLNIDSTALNNMSGLTSLTIPESCTYGEKLLEGCVSMQTLTISNGFETISTMFGGTIPESLNKVEVKSWKVSGEKRVIPEGMFSGFTKEIVFDNNYDKIDKNAFNGTNISILTISDNCTEISEGAFNGMGNLTDLTLPQNCAYTSSIISECGKLEKLSLPNAQCSVSEIFGGNTPKSLKELTIRSWKKDGNKVIPNSMFENISNLTLNYPSDYTAIGNNAFKGTDITSIEISNTCVSIGESAFVGTKISSLTIPDSVKSIGESAFQGVSLLSSLTMSSSCESIGDKAFKGTSISTLALKSGATIGKEAFACVPTLETLTIASGCAKIGDRAFMQTGIKSLTIPDSVVEIGESAFEDCLKLTDVIFDGFSQAKTFNAHAFKGSKNITNTRINASENTYLSGTKWLDSTFKALDENNLNESDGDCNPTFYSKNLLINSTPVESVADNQDATIAQVISNFAFINVGSIKGVSLYKTSSVGSYAFFGCGELSNIKITDGVNDINSYAFANCGKLKTLELKAHGNIGDYAFYGNKLIENININVVGNIGEYALAGASDGSSITNKLDFICKGNVAGTALKNHKNIKEAKVEITGEFSGLLDDATKIYKIEITSSNGYEFNNTFTDLQYLTYRLNGSNLTLNSTKKVKAPNVKTIAFVGNGNLSIGSDAFGLGKLYMLQFGNTDGSSSNISISSIKDDAFFSDANFRPQLFEIINTTAQDLSSAKFYKEKLNYATSLENSKMVFAKNYDGVYFKTTYQEKSGGISEDIYQLVDFREDNRTSYEFFDEIEKVTDIYGNEVALGKVKVIGGLFGFNKTYFRGTERVYVQSYGFNSTIKSVKVSAGVAESTGLCFFTNLESIEYKEGTTSVAGVASNVTNMSGGSVTLKSVKLPSTVTNLKAKAFANCSNLETFETTDSKALSIKKIADEAFRNCGKLTDLSLIIGDATETIGLSAFNGTGITAVSLGENVKEIASDAFNNCHNLVSFTFKSSFTFSGTYYGSDTYFIGCENLATISSVEAPTEFGVFSKGNCLYAFRPSENSITLLYIAKNGAIIDDSNLPLVNATHIGSFAFTNYYGVKTEWTLPSSVKKIEEKAFYQSKVTKLVFDSVEEIGQQAFYGSMINTITTSDNYNYVGIKFNESLANIGRNAFANCLEITSVVLPNSITQISDGLFANSSISSIEMPSVKLIGVSAFEETNNLTSININKSLQTISASAFKNSSVALLSFENDSQLTSIGVSAFENTNLASVSLPDSIELVSEATFRNCTKLTNINLNKVKTIETEGFANTGLVNVDLSKLVNIGNGAFENTNLTDISSLSTKLSTIGEYAFKNTNLMSVILPSGVQSIGKEAFGGLTNVKEIITPFLGSYKLSVNSNIEEEISKGYASGLEYLFGSNYCKEIDKIEIITTIDYLNVQFNLSDLGNAKVKSLILTKFVSKIIDSNSEKYISKNLRFDELKYCGSFMDWCKLAHDVDSAPAQITDSIYYLNNGEFKLIEGVVSIGYEGSNETFILGDGKFKEYNKITGVQFVQNGKVGVSAFENTQVNSISLGDNTSDVVVRLSSRAFKNTKITRINLLFIDFVKDDSTLNIGEQFANNALLETITNFSLWNISKAESTYVFSGCEKLSSAGILDLTPSAPIGYTNWFQYFYSDPSHYQVPSGTFKDCVMLSQVELPKNIEKIGKSAFENCTNLSSVSIKFNKANAYMSVAKNYSYGKYLLISESAFANCVNLETLSFNGVWGYANASGSAKNTNFGTFYIEGKDSTGEQNIAVDSYGLIGFKSKAFLNCNKLARVNYIGEIDEVLSSESNSYESKLENLWIENLFEVNGDFTSDLNNILSSNPLFYGAKLYVGASLENASAVTEISGKQIKKTAWAGSGIEKVVFNDKSDSSSKLLLVNCKSLREIKFETWNSINVVYNNNVAFRGCTNLTTINLCDNLKNGIYENNDIHWSAENGLLCRVTNDGTSKELFLAFGNTFNDALVTSIHEYAFIASGLKEITLSTLRALSANAITYSDIENVQLSTSESGVWKLTGTSFNLNYTINNPDNLKDEIVVGVGGKELSVIDWLKMGARLVFKSL